MGIQFHEKWNKSPVHCNSRQQMCGSLRQKTNTSKARGIVSTAVACCLKSKWGRMWHYTGSCGGVVGWGTVLQARRLWVWPWLNIEIFHWHNPSSRTLALGSTQGLTEVSASNISRGVKASWCLGLTTLSPSCANGLEIWEPQPPGTLRACPSL